MFRLMILSRGYFQQRRIVVLRCKIEMNQTKIVIYERPKNESPT
jgi:hypothetical protein